MVKGEFSLGNQRNVLSFGYIHIYRIKLPVKGSDRVNSGKSFKDRLVGEEINLPVGELGEPNPIQVNYTYYEGKPESHRLEFLQKGRLKFEIFLL